VQRGKDPGLFDYLVGAGLLEAENCLLLQTVGVRDALMLA
jgi:hypothetical protein